MKLRSKVSLIIASVWAIICIAVIIDSKLILEKNYARQETRLAQKDIVRVRNALKNKIQALALYTNSWSQWDDAYRFMQKKSKSFIEQSFVPGTYTSSSINFFLFYDTQGDFYYGQAYDLNKNEVIPIPAGLLQELSQNKAFITHQGTNPKNAGIFKIPEGIVVLSSLPVLDSDGKLTPRGSLLMGYFLSETHIKDLAKTVEMNVQFYPLPLDTTNIRLQTVLLALLKSNQDYLQNINDSTMYGYTLINDVDERPVGIMQVSIPRLLYTEGVTTLNHFLITIIIFGLLLLTTLWFVIKKLVLDRVLNISNQVVDINKKGDFSNRIALNGSDELAIMTNSLNSMLEFIELIQDQLKYRISQRTKDLEKASKINRNLFTQMGKHKSMEAKLEEEKKQLSKMAYYDTLTGLPNRACFGELLEKAIAQTDGNKKLAIIFFDVDKFKKINDTYGHEFGDKFLKEIASRLKRSITQNDVAARLSGDEFILFISNVSSIKMVDDAIENIFQNLTALVNIDKIMLTPTFSMGVSIFPDDGKELQKLCQKADYAMYKAKKREGNIYFYFSAIEDTKSPV